MPRCWGLHLRRHLYETAKWGDGRMNLKYASWRQGAWSLCGVEKQGGLRCEERWLEVGKGEVAGTLYQCVWFMGIVTGCMSKNGGTSMTRGWSVLMSKGHSLDPQAGWILGLVVPICLSHLELDRGWLQVLENNLCHCCYKLPLWLRQ